MVVIKTTFSNPTKRPYSIPMCWRWGQAEKKWNRKEWRKPKTMAYASTFFIHLTSFSSWPWWPVTKSTFHSNRLQTYHSTWHVKSLEHKSGEHSPITMKHAHDDEVALSNLDEKHHDHVCCSSTSSHRHMHALWTNVMTEMSCVCYSRM